MLQKEVNVPDPSVQLIVTDQCMATPKQINAGQVYLYYLKKFIILIKVAVCLLFYALWYNWMKYIQK